MGWVGHPCPSLIIHHFQVEVSITIQLIEPHLPAVSMKQTGDPTCKPSPGGTTRRKTNLHLNEMRACTLELIGNDVECLAWLAEFEAVQRCRHQHARPIQCL